MAGVLSRIDPWEAEGPLLYILPLSRLRPHIDYSGHHLGSWLNPLFAILDSALDDPDYDALLADAIPEIGLWLPFGLPHQKMRP